jgi:predicted RNA-binding Zn ribbon-like protein
MTVHDADSIFIADAIGLDFLNSIATPVDTPVETIGSGEDLLAWLSRSQLVPAEVADGFLKSAVPGELDAIAAQARALREWFRSFVQEHKGRPLQADAVKELAPLNRILEREEEFGQIVPRTSASPDAPGGLEWKQERRWRSPDSLLIPLARSMADVICADDFSQIKNCEGAHCTLIFVDRTRGRARRWCSMSVCGNRMKAQAHRDRAKAAGQPIRRVSRAGGSAD